MFHAVAKLKMIECSFSLSVSPTSAPPPPPGGKKGGDSLVPVAGG